jgi:hypothetical protein
MSDTTTPQDKLGRLLADLEGHLLDEQYERDHAGLSR